MIFTYICFVLSGSILIRKDLYLPKSALSSTLYFFAFASNIFFIEPTKSMLSTYSSFNSILFCSILFISRMSFIICSRKLPESIIWSMHSSFFFISVLDRPIAAMPSIAFIGVLISWLILDKKSVFARLAFIASSLFCCICSINFFLLFM